MGNRRRSDESVVVVAAASVVAECIRDVYAKVIFSTKYYFYLTPVLQDIII